MLRVGQEQKISEMVSVGDISFSSTRRTPTYFLVWSSDFNKRQGGGGGSLLLTVKRFIRGITAEKNYCRKYNNQEGVSEKIRKIIPKVISHAAKS